MQRAVHHLASLVRAHRHRLPYAIFTESFYDSGSRLKRSLATRHELKLRCPSYTTALGCVKGKKQALGVLPPKPKKKSEENPKRDMKLWAVALLLACTTCLEGGGQRNSLWHGFSRCDEIIIGLRLRGGYRTMSPAIPQQARGICECLGSSSESCLMGVSNSSSQAEKDTALWISLVHRNVKDITTGGHTFRFASYARMAWLTVPLTSAISLGGNINSTLSDLDKQALSTHGMQKLFYVPPLILGEPTDVHSAKSLRCWKPIHAAAVCSLPSKKMMYFFLPPFSLLFVGPHSKLLGLLGMQCIHASHRAWKRVCR